MTDATTSSQLTHAEIDALHRQWRRSEERFRMVGLLRAGGDLTDASRELDALLNDDPDFPAALLEQAAIRAIQGDWGEAARRIARTLELGARLPAAVSLARQVLSASYHETSPFYSRLESLLVPQPPTVTLAMIVKNESAHLARCLRSVERVVDRMVVVDTGSTDDTPQIARDFGAEVYHFTWIQDFAAARNESLKHVTEDWTLWLDADEELLPPSRDALNDLLRDEQIAGAHLRIDNLMGGNTISFLTTRLWRTHPTVIFRQPIHEQITWALFPLARRYGRKVVEAPPVGLKHYGYHPSVAMPRRKDERNLDMLEMLVKREPNNAYALFHYAGSLRQIGKREEALRIFGRWEPLVAPMRRSDNEWIEVGFATYVATLNELGRYSDAYLLATREIEHHGASISLLSYRAAALHHMGRSREALADLEQAERIPRGVRAGVEVTDFQPLYVPMLKAEIYSALGETERARVLFLEATRTSPEDPSPRHSLARIYLRDNNLDAAAEQYEAVLRHHADEPQTLASLAHIEIFRQRFQRAEELLTKAVVLDPKGECYRLLGEVRLFLGDLDGAEKAWGQVSDLGSVAGHWALFFILSGQPDKGFSLLTDAKAQSGLWALTEKILVLHAKKPVLAADYVLRLAKSISCEARFQPLRTALLRVFLKHRFQEGIAVLRSSVSTPRK